MQEEHKKHMEQKSVKGKQASKLKKTNPQKQQTKNKVGQAGMEGKEKSSFV